MLKEFWWENLIAKQVNEQGKQILKDAKVKQIIIQNGEITMKGTDGKNYKGSVDSMPELLLTLPQDELMSALELSPEDEQK